MTSLPDLKAKLARALESAPPPWDVAWNARTEEAWIITRGNGTQVALLDGRLCLGEKARAEAIVALVNSAEGLFAAVEAGKLLRQRIEEEPESDLWADVDAMDAFDAAIARLEQQP